MLKYFFTNVKKAKEIKQAKTGYYGHKQKYSAQWLQFIKNKFSATPFYIGQKYYLLRRKKHLKRLYADKRWRLSMLNRLKRLEENKTFVVGRDVIIRAWEFKVLAKREMLWEYRSVKKLNSKWYILHKQQLRTYPTHVSNTHGILFIKRFRRSVSLYKEPSWFYYKTRSRFFKVKRGLSVKYLFKKYSFKFARYYQAQLLQPKIRRTLPRKYKLVKFTIKHAFRYHKVLTRKNKSTVKYQKVKRVFKRFFKKKDSFDNISPSDKKFFDKKRSFSSIKEDFTTFHKKMPVCPSYLKINSLNKKYSYFHSDNILAGSRPYGALLLVGDDLLLPTRLKHLEHKILVENLIEFSQRCKVFLKSKFITQTAVDRDINEGHSLLFFYIGLINKQNKVKKLTTLENTTLQNLMYRSVFNLTVSENFTNNTFLNILKQCAVQRLRLVKARALLRGNTGFFIKKFYFFLSQFVVGEPLRLKLFKTLFLPYKNNYSLFKKTIDFIVKRRIKHKQEYLLTFNFKKKSLYTGLCTPRGKCIFSYTAGMFMPEYRKFERPRAIRKAELSYLRSLKPKAKKEINKKKVIQRHKCYRKKRQAKMILFRYLHNLLKYLKHRRYNIILRGAVKKHRLFFNILRRGLNMPKKYKYLRISISRILICAPQKYMCTQRAVKRKVYRKMFKRRL